MKRDLGIVLLVVLLLAACKKDVDTFIPDPTSPVFVSAKGTLGGWITDAEGQAIPGVQVQLGGVSTESDYNGVFFWDKLEVPEAGDVLRFTRPSYFSNTLPIQEKDGFKLQLGMRLLERTQAGSIDLNTGGAIDLPQGARINIPPLSAGVNGHTPFEGEAALFAKWVDLSDPDHAAFRPGGSYGEDVLGERKALEMWGMVVVEAETASGEPLQILPDKEMALAFPVPLSLQDEADATIKLWHLNPESGIWEERGAAQYFNGSYTGSADAFGYWVCARDYPAVSFNTVLKKAGNEMLEGIPWRIDFENGLPFSQARTTSGGFMALDVPAGIPFQLTLLTDCGSAVETLDLGPYSEATSLASISLNAPGVYPHKVVASLANCAGQPVSRGYVKLIRGNHTQFLFPNSIGGVSTWLGADCQGNNLIAIGVNLEDPLESLPIERSLEAVVDLGTISVCLDAEEYIALTLDSETYLGTDPLAYREGSQTFLQDEAAGIEFVIDGVAAGTFNLDTDYFIFPDFSNQNTANASLSCQISYYGDPGDYIIGTFGGSFEDLDGESHSISGSFKVIRAY